MSRIIEQIKKDSEKNKIEHINNIEIVEKKNNRIYYKSFWTYQKNYIDNDKSLDKFKSFINKKIAQDLENEINSINNIMTAGEFQDTNITIEFKRSYMWGYNPTAYDNYNRNSGSIGGCGYDKESTAMARILNENLPLMKLLYIKKNDNINTSNRELFGYGSGYFIKPMFEGGVGVSCYYSILESIGLKFQCISSSSKSVNVYTITKL